LVGGLFALRRRSDGTGLSSQSKLLPQALTTKPPFAERAKPCSTYGAGFVQIPGSGAYGGSVAVEGHDPLILSNEAAARCGA
jgi:hypothetical protein